MIPHPTFAPVSKFDRLQWHPFLPPVFLVPGESQCELEVEAVEYERDATVICAALQDCAGNPALPWDGLISHSVSAASAIPFISHAKRDSLLALARGHQDPDVRLEASWAAARLKMHDGNRELSQATLDWKSGATAKRYMEELGIGDQIPESAHDPGLVALGEIARWLAHPCEFAVSPTRSGYGMVILNAPVA